MSTFHFLRLFHSFFSFYSFHSLLHPLGCPFIPFSAQLLNGWIVLYKIIPRDPWIVNWTHVLVYLSITEDINVVVFAVIRMRRMMMMIKKLFIKYPFLILSSFFLYVFIKNVLKWWICYYVYGWLCYVRWYYYHHTHSLMAPYIHFYDFPLAFICTSSSSSIFKSHLKWLIVNEKLLFYCLFNMSLIYNSVKWESLPNIHYFFLNELVYE